MDPTVLAKIAFRILAIYLLSQGLVYLPSVLAIGEVSRAEGGGTLYALQALMVTGLPLLVGIILWVIAPVLSRFATGTPHPEAKEATAPEIQAIAISTVGLLLLFTALPRLATTFYHAVVQAPQLDGVRYYNDALVGHLVGIGLQVILALVLIVGAGFFPRLLWKIRMFGLRSESSN